MRTKMFAAVAGVALLTACSADKTDFKKATETFLEKDKSVQEQTGTKFTDASCTAPAKLTAGETYTCTAVDSGGVTWDFDVEVKDSSNFLITSGQPRP